MPQGFVVVTGSVSGIGRASAEQLARLGYDVIPVMRRHEPLPHPVQQPVLLDIADAAQVGPACEQILNRSGGRIAALVNNAGINVAGPFEVLPITEWRRQFEVNFFGHLEVTRTLLPALLAAGGRIVNIGSIGGRFSLPFLGPYSASKFAMRAWSDAIRLELAPHGVPVVLIEPGAIATPMWEKGLASADAMVAGLDPDIRRRYADQIAGGRKAAAMAERHAIPVERCAKVVTKAVTTDKPRGHYLVGPDAWVQAAISLLPPSFSDAITRRGMGQKAAS
jgi:NAD(P)-dependent dehydrogenase (short-subunit alcohol dehydrogenase family)